MISDNLLNDLEDIVNEGLKDSSIPYAKGNSIRIKQYVVRQSKVGFLVYDSSTNKQVHRTQFKSVAIAIAKNLAERRNRIDKILDIENNLAKHYNDAVFYKNMIKKSKCEHTRLTRETRLEISLVEAQKNRDKLDQYIYA
jgi:hypothetical protein|tara:strand:- start:386 stop:805 length:420 start_codon:yes stop_codon:yes gene_type:complete